jgi:hypothetical protein
MLLHDEEAAVLVNVDAKSPAAMAREMNEAILSKVRLRPKPEFRTSRML